MTLSFKKKSIIKKKLRTFFSFLKIKNFYEKKNTNCAKNKIQKKIRYCNLLLFFNIPNEFLTTTGLAFSFGYWRKVMSYSVGLKLQGLEKRSHQV